MNILLIGYMGSGKTTLGQRWAHTYGMRFVDLDERIEALVGRDIPTIFEAEGEETFRDYERQILEGLLQGDGQVIATGGGTPCHGDNMDQMNRAGYTVYLRVPPEVLADQLKAEKKERPLIADVPDEELANFIRAHLKERSPYYEEAQRIIDLPTELDLVL